MFPGRGRRAPTPRGALDDDDGTRSAPPGDREAGEHGVDRRVGSVVGSVAAAPPRTALPEGAAAPGTARRPPRPPDRSRRTRCGRGCAGTPRPRPGRAPPAPRGRRRGTAPRSPGRPCRRTGRAPTHRGPPRRSSRTRPPAPARWSGGCRRRRATPAGGHRPIRPRPAAAPGCASPRRPASDLEEELDVVAEDVLDLLAELAVRGRGRDRASSSASATRRASTTIGSSRGSRPSLRSVQPALTLAEHLARAADLEVALGELEPVGRRRPSPPCAPCRRPCAGPRAGSRRRVRRRGRCGRAAGAAGAARSGRHPPRPSPSRWARRPRPR